MKVTDIISQSESEYCTPSYLSAVDQTWKGWRGRGQDRTALSPSVGGSGPDSASLTLPMTRPLDCSGSHRTQDWQRQLFFFFLAWATTRDICCRDACSPCPSFTSFLSASVNLSDFFFIRKFWSLWGFVLKSNLHPSDASQPCGFCKLS